MIYYIIIYDDMGGQEMELRHLKSFCVAAKLRNMSKAAEHLQVGQPTVTMHIKKLEEELGTVLFDRFRRPIQPTLAGATLAELAGPLIEGIEALAARASLAEETGPVLVASTADLIPHSLLQVVKAFRGLYPQVHLRIRSALRVEVLRIVAEGEADIGVVPGPERAAEFEFQGLFAYERVAITPLGHPLLEEPLTSLEQIARWPLILMRQGTYTRTMLEGEFHRRGLAYDIVMELDSMDMIKRFVALGMGISVGPLLAIEPENREDLGVVGLGALLPVEQAGFLTLRGRTLSTPARHFAEVLKKALGSKASST